MYDIEINDGQFKLKCLKISEEVFNNCIRLNLIFKKIPDIFLKFGTAGVMIDKIKVYNTVNAKYKKYLPVYRSSIITSIREENFKCVVYMESLKIEYGSGDIVKNCVGPKCNRKISYLQVMCSLIDIVKDEETAENIWNSELVSFYAVFVLYIGLKSKGL